jgi:dihydroxyacetone kinase-like predicted kinase
MDQMATPQRPGEPSDVPLQPFEPETIAVVAVAPGFGFARVFASLGVAAIVPGGQTMNPSTQEILDAFEDLPTDHVVILPNNKNIILAAEQAAEVSKKKVSVIPCVSAPQGIAAMFAYNPQGAMDEVVEAMKSSYSDLNWAEITTATRSVEIDGVQVEEGQVIGLLNGKLACSGEQIGEVLMDTLKQATPPGTELITLFRGKDLDEDEIAGLTELISSQYPDYEIEVHEGSQPHYQVILSIE